MNQRFETDFVAVLPLRDQVIFPGSISPVMVSRDCSRKAVEEALGRDKRLFVVCQIEAEVDNPEPSDLYEVGVVSEIIELVEAPDGSMKILLEGCFAARTVDMMEAEKGGFHQAFVVRNQVALMDETAAQAHVRSIRGLFSTYCKRAGGIPDKLRVSVNALKDPLHLAYAIANYAALKIEEKQDILDSNSLEEMFLLLHQSLDAENQILALENELAGQVKDQIGRSQREYYLTEKLKAIERELGMDGGEDNEIRELAEAIDKSEMPEEALEKAEKELHRLARMAPLSPEAAITRTYLEWLTEVPWTFSTVDRIDLDRARKVLEKQHYGLEEVKNRIIEYLAVVKHAGAGRGPVLCFVGPPGVGKTSLVESIAKCVGRRFVRISLGGVRDEAEIRGHRRTYVGALPGKIIQSMKRAGSQNPVFLLDEIDKTSSDFRGDPASALLEVLDPEQNRQFNDHYLDVDYDLSKVMFITTANTIDGIPYPLLDRMEVIRIPGYTELEKTHIVMKHLVGRQREAHGLKATDFKLPKTSVQALIRGYTREAGVRNLDRAVAALCRKRVTQVVEMGEKAPSGHIGAEQIREFLGPVKFRDSEMDQKPEIGLANGLAWTEVGGELLPVETTLMKGKGELILTGKLGEVMRESARTALSWIRGHAEELGADPDFHKEQDIHIHIPEGAIPKDGPSAGITLATSMVSAITGRPVRMDVAMTGEITLRGRVLKIGGLKEKVLAALRHKIQQVIIPEENADEVETFPEEAMKQLQLSPVKSIEDVLEIVLLGDKSVKKTRTTPKRGRTPSSGRAARAAKA